MATLHSTLSSTRPNDDISADIAELVGFDDIELVMEILDNRATVVQEVSRMTDFPPLLKTIKSKLQSF
jgi:antiviral helicase SLH1